VVAVIWLILVPICILFRSDNLLHLVTHIYGYRAIGYDIVIQIVFSYLENILCVYRSGLAHTLDT
jgi:hypothetical protein